MFDRAGPGRGRMRFGYPLMLDVSNRPAVIVGGGAVAARKASGLVDAGATRVTVVSPTFHPDLPSAVVRVAERYEPRHLDGLSPAALVFAATDRKDVNDAVVRDAAGRGLLVNRADVDDDQPGDFATPAQLKRGPIAVTVSAGSPALAATIRDGLADRWDARWTAMAEAMRVLRPRIVGHPELTPSRRAEVFRALATAEAMDAAGVGGTDAVVAWLVERFRLTV
jgi:precorrin-2 dehydrogenase/sirohydrochlorin ferrochelatase